MRFQFYDGGPKSQTVVLIKRNIFTYKTVYFFVMHCKIDVKMIVSGSFDRCLRVWSLPDCELLRTIDAKHPVNCVSVNGDVVASW